MYKVIDSTSFALSFYERSRISGLRDILLRRPAPFYRSPNQELEWTKVIFEHGSPVGFVSYQLQDVIVYISEVTGRESLLLGSLLHFPVTNTFAPPIWNPLIHEALDALAKLGATEVYTYVPNHGHRYRAYLRELGFQEMGYCDNAEYLASLGFAQTCTVLAKSFSDRTQGQVDAYPYLAGSFVQLQADVRNAPRSNILDWEKAYMYSGYSGYPFMPDFLRKIVDRDVRSILSVPCATGDVLRFLPYSALPALESVVGVDVTPRFVAFAKERMQDPNIDLLNRFLCWAFYQDIAGYTHGRARKILDQIWARLDVSIGEHDRLQTYAQMCAMFQRGVISGAIADWFCLTKGTAEVSFRDQHLDMFDKAATLSARLGEDFIHSLFQEYQAAFMLEDDVDSRNACRQMLDRGVAELVCWDMYDLDLNRRFDLILVWEAALMVVADGNQEQFVAMLKRHVNEGGYLVLTGIRMTQPTSPHELVTMAKLLTKSGFAVVTANLRFQPAAWSYRPIQEKWAPTLIARARGG